MLLLAIAINIDTGVIGMGKLIAPFLFANLGDTLFLHSELLSKCKFRVYF